MFAVPQEIKIITVTKLNRFAKQVLESEIGQVWVSGEISNFTRASSGHWYFTLKDDKAQVSGAMFKGANQKLNFTPKHGDKVVVRANLSLYEARGNYQLIAVHMEPEGVGQLKQAFEALKLRLEADGLFSHTAKQPLPPRIQTIGLVTSATGAAVHDILHVLERRNPSIQVIIYPSMVQGDGAPASIVKQIETANRRNEVDVLVVGRGGGSLEDLWSFNEEVVARAIYQSQLPIISAVGHEVDVTISDFVADVRAATPSAAAEMLSDDTQNLQNNINERKRALMRALQQVLSHKQQIQQSASERLYVQHPGRDILQHSQALDYLTARLHAQHPSQRIEQQRQASDYLYTRLLSKHPSKQLTEYKSRLDTIEKRMLQALTKRLELAKQTFKVSENKLAHISPKQNIVQHLKRTLDLQVTLNQLAAQHIKVKQQNMQASAALLHSVSPLATLARGYSITLKDKTVVSSTDQVRLGDTITTKLKDGELNATITHIHQK